jgi:hypothetical protein
MKEKRSLKEFVKEHKCEIIFGGLCVLGGVYIGKKCGLTKTEKRLVNNLKGTNPIFEKEDAFMNNINKMVEGANKAHAFRPTGNENVHTLTNHIKDVLDIEGSKIETTGVLIFVK